MLTVLITVAVLYFARTVLIPLALAVLVAFLLGPLVIRLRHWGLGRVPSAVSVVLLAFILLGVVGTLVTSQLTDLAHKLPEYQHNVHQKLQSIRSSGGGFINRASQAVQSLTAELNPPQPAKNQAGEQKPVPVEIHRSVFSPMEAIQTILGSLLNMLLVAGLVIVFVIFMLIEREDLRDRLIWLAGAERVNITTKLLDDAAHRVSRYLLAQFVVNVTYGTLVGVGLFFLGIPNPLLWGVLATLFRYIPYLGIWIAAIMPAAVALAVEPGWMKVPAVFGLYIGIDLLTYNFVEPPLYGSSTGISPLGILVAAVVWTWLWGAVGLLVAIPLTVCVVSIGRHVPSLRFLSVLLSDELILPPQTRFYQRMLAMDLDEATEVAAEFLKGKSLEELYDTVIIPALSLAEEDRHRGKLDEVRQQFIFRNTRILIEDLAERADELIAGNGSAKARSTASAEGSESHAGSLAVKEINVVCIPARDEADQLASLMLVQLLAQRGIGARALSAEALAGESLEEISREKPPVAAVLSVPPFGYMHARYLCRRLHSQLPELKVVAAILTEGDLDELKQRQPGIPADELASSLRQALTQILSLIPARTEQPAQPVLRAAS